MPADDVGSTVDEATDLGTLSAAMIVSGLIGSLNDIDNYSFTAGLTGTVSFTASNTHDLVASWDAGGGTVSGASGEVLTLDVVGGQDYAIGISTSAGIGYYDGFLGPGAGAFWTTACVAIYRMDIVHASGVARFMNFVSNIVSLHTFMALGLVEYGTGLAMGLSLMIGAHIGAHSAIRFGAPFIRPVFVLVVLGMAGRLIWQEWL